MQTEMILQDLNEQQIDAVQHIDGPMLVLAGAGSGKTRAITRRIAYLIASGVDPRTIVAITFTNKAANEMLSRVTALLQRLDYTGYGQPMLATFHAFSVRLLRTYGQVLGIEPSFTIFDEPDRRKLVKLAANDTATLPAGLTVNKVADIISRAKNQLIGPDDVAGMPGLSDFYRSTIARVYSRYEELLRHNNGMDFDGLLNNALLLMNDDDTAQAIRNRYGYVLIDEYQDTNRVQYLLAKSICRGTDNLCATGDPDQAIYSWRGADLRNILEFQKDYPEAKVVKLEQNYRSTGSILQAADSLIIHNLKRKKKNLIPVHGQGDPVQVHTSEDEVEEADKVVEIIQQAQRDGIELSEIAVFCRVNSLLRNVEQALGESAIPYEMARGVSFFQKREIKDAVAYLRILFNPADQVALERIINTPTRGIGAKAQETLKSYADANGMTMLEATRHADAIPELGRSVANVKKFATLIDELNALISTLTLTEFTRQMIERTTLREHYVHVGEKDKRPDELSPAANLTEFVSMVEAYETSEEDLTFQDLMARLALVSDVDSVKQEGDRLALMTIHSAKGLEFKVVIIIAVEEEIVPHMLCDEVEEERRLFFVAMTRAKQFLHICHAQRRSTRGSYHYNSPSRFLKELDPQVVEGLNLTALTPPKRQNQFVINPKRKQDDDKITFTPPKCTYRSGQRVYHDKFGYGVIEEIHLSGNYFTGTVRFHNAGTKKLVLSLAPIHPVE